MELFFRSHVDFRVRAGVDRSPKIQSIAPATSADTPQRHATNKELRFQSVTSGHEISTSMNDPYRYGRRPFAFMFRYVRLRPTAHAVILAAVLAAVACSVGTQYGVKYPGRRTVGCQPGATTVWYAFLFLVSLIAADNLLWRLAGWVASFTFVARHGRLAARSVSPPDRPFAELFRRPPARHPDEPHYRHVERHLHPREHVHLECVAALRGHASQPSHW